MAEPEGVDHLPAKPSISTLLYLNDALVFEYGHQFKMKECCCL